MADKPIMIFISYASEDRARVRPLRRRLQEDFRGVHFWFDQEDIPPAFEWDPVIQKAIRDCQAMILFLSTTSVEKEGYIQKEFRWAIDRADQMPEGHPFLFWVRLDDCPVPARLSRWQGCDLFGGEAGYQRLKQGVQFRLDQLRNRKPAGQEQDHAPLAAKRMLLLATPAFPLQVFKGVYREETGRELRTRSGPSLAYELDLEHGTALLLQADPKDAQYLRLDSQIHQFHPEGILVLGMGVSRLADPGALGQLVVPEQVLHYRVHETPRNGGRDPVLVEEPHPFTPGLPHLSGTVTPRRVGVISTDGTLGRLEKQIRESGLDVIELEEARLLTLASDYTRDWLLVSAIAGHAGLLPPSAAMRDSAAYAISKYALQLLGLDKKK